MLIPTCSVSPIPEAYHGESHLKPSLNGVPRWRNRRLAEALQILGLVERCGMGVAKMFKHQLEYGKAPPVYDVSTSHLVVDIPTEMVDEKLAAWVSDRYKKGTIDLDVYDLLILSQMRARREIRSSMRV